LKQEQEQENKMKKLPQMIKKFENKNFDNIICLVEYTEREEYGHVTVQFAYTIQVDDETTPSGYKEVVRFFDNYLWDGECILQGLRFSCQYGLRDDGSTPARKPYAFRFGYRGERDFNTCNIEKLELKLKLLKLMERRISKYEEKFGNFTDKDNFGRFVSVITSLFGDVEFSKRKPTNSHQLEFDKIYMDIEDYINNLIAGE